MLLKIKKSKTIEVMENTIIIKKRAILVEIILNPKKLVLVLATSMVVIGDNKKIVKVPYICYLV